MVSSGTGWKLAIHGPVVELNCRVPALDSSIDALLGDFSVQGWPADFMPAEGNISPYHEGEVLSRLPANARHFSSTPDGMDIYGEAGRFWLVDDRWGMTEVDLARDCWHSWVLPEPKLDALRVTELAVLWPLSQLMRSRGLHLLPAVSVVRDGFAVLLICPFGVEAELTAMSAGGYKIIGQRWTALRQEEGRLALLRMPGRVERFSAPRLRFTTDADQTWLDLTQAHHGSWQNHAFCDAVIVAEAGRRAKAHLREHEGSNAINLLKREWPMIHLDSVRQINALPAQLVESCRCYELQLSRNPKDLLALLNSMRYGNPLSHDQAAAA